LEDRFSLFFIAQPVGMLASGKKFANNLAWFFALLKETPLSRHKKIKDFILFCAQLFVTL
jgi:hypothetical protein